MANVSFGIKTAPQMTTYDDILGMWQAADAIPVLEHAWLFDHFAPISGNPIDGPCLEGWTLLAALAARTQRLRVGIMVTGNTYRHPAVLANMGATIDILSNGRLDFGIGAGWNEMEHDMYGIPLYAPGERIRRMGEACEVIRLLWTQPKANFTGKYYQLHDALCEPKPIQKPYPPFTIGGSGEQLTLKMVARYADIWNFVGGDIDVFHHKIAILHEHCHAIGRDPAAIRISVQPAMDYENLDASRANVKRYIDAGANHIILNFRAPYPDHIVQRVVDEVVAKI